MLIDAHAHLDKYTRDQLPLVLSSLAEREILTVSVSVDEESYVNTEAIATGSNYVIATFGIHPWEAPQWEDRLDSVEELIARSPMIGEIGLDYRFVEETRRHRSQRIVFEHLLRQAGEQGKVVNVHCAGAEADTAAMLQEHSIQRAIVHWYSGPLSVLAQMIEQGYMFSIGVEVLFSDHVREIASIVPAGQLLTETDSPGGHRWLTGEVGMPPHLELVIDQLANIRGVNRRDIQDTVASNFGRLIAGDPYLKGWGSVLSGG